MPDYVQKMCMDMRHDIIEWVRSGGGAAAAAVSCCCFGCPNLRLWGSNFVRASSGPPQLATARAWSAALPPQLPSDDDKPGGILRGTGDVIRRWGDGNKPPRLLDATYEDEALCAML